MISNNRWADIGGGCGAAPEVERLLAGHDAEHHVVGGTHRLLAYAGKVAYGAVYVGVDDALGAGHKLALARQQG